MWEGLIDEAVDAMSQFGADRSQLLKMARDCEIDRPKKAVEIYLDAAEQSLAGHANSKARYRDASQVLGRCASAAEAADLTAEFQLGLSEIRQRHARKRRFIEMIAEL